MWKTYLFIVIPMMRPVFITTLVIIAAGIVKVYDLVVAQTSGGPGIASEVPAKYVYDYMFHAQNLGQGFAASTMMLLSVVIIIVPWAYLEFGRRQLMSNPGTLAAAVAGADALRGRLADEPRGPRPRRALSRRNILLYGTLIVVALYYLLPLYVMIVTSLKGMPEIRARQHLRAAAGDHLRAVGQGLGDGLHRPELRRPVARLLELGAHHRALGRPVDRHRLGQRLRAGQLALQGRRHLLHHPDRRRLHPLPGDDLPDRHHAARDRPLRHAARAW